MLLDNLIAFVTFVLGTFLHFPNLTGLNRQATLDYKYHSHINNKSCVVEE